jgi:carbon monoxide dehydrogenase subunit G
MKLHYEGRVDIAATPDEVFAFMASPEKVAACLPDVISTEIADATHFTSVVRVGVGLVKGKFTFDVALDPKPELKTVEVTIHGGGLGSMVDQTAHAVITQQGVSLTTLDWASDAVISGPVATLGGHMLDSQAKRIISHVFARVGETLNGRSG